ncbi:E4 SUMO-protein ligase PIAL2-like [Trifolium pratense]|uniref:E4 SUMO-protein ligase PIAL2-like n=1 Tax=Trifolium pratense TaxID=57577 RepID=UPI001E695179|nr:E4 SUMO-protein ligase PIAL2-like [Trifolium pratense]
METNTLSPSLLNKHRISTTIDRLTWHFQQGNRSDSVEFTKLCTILSRGIDFAIANCETPPPKANKLPFLIKQMNHRRKTEDVPSSLACVMVLCISVKNACKFGWFNMKDSEEILTIVDELGKMYCTMGNLHTGFRFSCHSTVLSEVMKRFYPNMKLGPIIVLNQVNPGYGASIIDFNITKNTFQPDKKIWLLVAQTDNIETSACLISPREVNFLVNGQAIDKRSMCRMDHGPQMPTSVGQFNGHYVVLVAYMSYNVVASLRPEHLPDYVQPVGGYSDSDIVEGESRISLYCPISFTRIKTPVKGCSCKHFQCFDFDNFVEINCKRPSWRCPHCNQYVCYTDIRLDRNMIEILEKVGDNVMEVIVHADGSLKEEVLMESDSSGLSSSNTGSLFINLSLCNASGIKSRKKKRAILGISKGNNEEGTKKGKKSNGGSGGSKKYTNINVTLSMVA